ncbi:MAG: MarR family winged helix-turn-helix transcriptional regulator [Acidimicrobiales bacterium]
MNLPDSAYAKLLALRTGLRHFERWSEQQAATAGLTAAQHQLLLAIRGHADPRGPTIGEAADYLLLRHHSAVGLVDRADAGGLLRRERDPEDHRVVRLKLTPKGGERLEALSALHLEELTRLAPEIAGVWEGLASVNSVHGFERVVTARPSEPDLSAAKRRTPRSSFTDRGDVQVGTVPAASTP